MNHTMRCMSNSTGSLLRASDFQCSVFFLNFIYLFLTDCSYCCQEDFQTSPETLFVSYTILNLNTVAGFVMLTCTKFCAIIIIKPSVRKEERMTQKILLKLCKCLNKSSHELFLRLTHSLFSLSFPLSG